MWSARIASFFTLMIVAILTILIAGCSAAPSTQEKPSKKITISTGQKIKKTNYNIFGNNIQWTHYADGLINPHTKLFDSVKDDLFQKIHMPSLRFPGGTHSDVYHWEYAIGKLHQRKPNQHVFLKASHDSHFGTDEFLKMCSRYNSTPLITINAVTGTPEEAAKWVEYCGTRVTYYEIGNEPYLEPEHHKNIDSNYPDEFAKKFVAIAKAMKKKNPNIKIGLPLGRDKKGRYPGSPYKNFINRVFGLCHPFADFISLHNAYFPLIFREKEESHPDSTLALLAAVEEVDYDTKEVLKELERLAPGKKWPIAITEYNCFFSPANLKSSQNIASTASALYVANLLSYYQKRDDILFAHYWSLCSNWYFGLLTPQNKPRPNYYVMQLFKEYLGESILEEKLSHNFYFNTKAQGYLPAIKDAKQLEVIVSQTNNKYFMILINKNIHSHIPIDIATLVKTKNLKFKHGKMIQSSSVLSHNENKQEVHYNDFIINDPNNINIPKHSVIGFCLVDE